MAYTKQNWECGDLITADKMNHIEDGIEEASSGGGSLIVTVTSREATVEECPDGGTVVELSHTWQQMHDAIAAGKQVYLRTVITEDADTFEKYDAVLGCGDYYITTTGTVMMPIRQLTFNSPTSNKVVECSIT